MKELVIDCETIWCPKGECHIPKMGPRERTDPREKLRFDPNYIRPCVIGFRSDNFRSSIGLNFFADMPSPEQTMLETFWDIVAPYDRFITFNGFSFDVPLLLRRSWYHGIRPTVQIKVKKYDSFSNHIDVRMILGNWDQYARGNLDLYSQLKFGRKKTDGIDGSLVQGLWDSGEYVKIHTYCLDDCDLTWELYQSLKGYYLPNPDQAI